mmetsp:Transcript_14557/g.27790  ORF Transcript_14557/g.27790 Transcript_14557/m.27790 type:complete len:901 (+) Transcript_14557:153-2855(+)
MISSCEVPVDGDPDEEDQAVVDAPEEPKRKNDNAGHNKSIIFALVTLVCVGITVGVLVARPWQTRSQELQSAEGQQQYQNTMGPEDIDEADISLTAPWPHANSDIQPDPRVTYGSLKNGLRYMIMENAEPPNQLMLRMHVDAGSYQEEEDQRGLAHFLEHMAFNGLCSVSADELIPQMQRLGIAFGAHANAGTYFDETFYQLDLPNSTDEQTLELGFTVMRDFADGIVEIVHTDTSLHSDEWHIILVGVILSEATSSDSVRSRLKKKLWGVLLSGHRIPLRWPIGDPDVVSTAPRQRFVDLYEEYYKPERITVIACGDADPREMERRIIEAYENMTRSDHDFDKPNDADLLGGIVTGTGFEALVFSDNELVDEEVSITFSRPYNMPADTESERVSQFPLSLAHDILLRRLQIAAKREGSPFRSGDADGSDRKGILGRSGIETGAISVTLASGGTGSWRDSIPIIEQEFRRALEFGFAQYEFVEVKANYRRYYQQMVDTAATRSSQGLAETLLETIKGEYVFTTPSEDLRIFTEAIKSITLDHIHAAFKSFWDSSDLKLVLYAKETAPDTPKIMEQIYNQSKEVVVEPPSLDFNETFLYTFFGQPGEIVSDTTQEDLGIRQLQLGNNIRVNLKTTDFEANAIKITAYFGAGKLSQDTNKPGIQWFAPQMMNDGGLGKHSKDELGRILAGKNVEVSFSVKEGFFTISGATTPDDLELEMQLLAASLTDPGFRTEALQYWKQSSSSYHSYFTHQILGAHYFVDEFLRGGDMRFSVPSLNEMNALTITDVQDWLNPHLKYSYLELSIVGTFGMDNAISVILNTFGALPDREESPSIVDDELRSLKFPKTPANRTFTYDSKLLQASSIVAWKVPPIEKDIAPTRRFNVLSSILSNRMRVSDLVTS